MHFHQISLADIRIGKSALKGMTLSSDLVSEWINSITCTVSDRPERTTSDLEPDCSLQKFDMEKSHGFKRSGSRFCRGRQISTSSNTISASSIQHCNCQHLLMNRDVFV